jgi:uncharacterized protein (TIGR02145 family)
MGNAIGGVLQERSANTGETSSKLLSKQAKVAVVIDDVIAATKNGYFNYRCGIGNSDNANPLKIAPKGWHVPWNIDNYLIANGYNWDGTTKGNKIAKSLAARTDWYQDSTDGCPYKDSLTNNSSGFSALTGGYRNSDGDYSHFNGLHYVSYWWSEPYVASWAWYRTLPTPKATLARISLMDVMACW